MADTFLLQGRWNTTPENLTLVASGCPTMETPFEEEFRLDKKSYQDISLDDDAAEAVPFGDITNAHVVLIKTDKKIQVALTSADGADQTVPVDSFLHLASESVPFTALTLTRLAGQATNVKVFLGEKP